MLHSPSSKAPPPPPGRCVRNHCQDKDLQSALKDHCKSASCPTPHTPAFSLTVSGASSPDPQFPTIPSSSLSRAQLNPEYQYQQQCPQATGLHDLLALAVSLWAPCTACVFGLCSFLGFAISSSYGSLLFALVVRHEPQVVFVGADCGPPGEAGLGVSVAVAPHAPHGTPPETHAWKSPSPNQGSFSQLGTTGGGGLDPPAPGPTRPSHNIEPSFSSRLLANRKKFLSSAFIANQFRPQIVFGAPPPSHPP